MKSGAQSLDSAARVLRSRFGEAPKLALVLGSGLGGFTAKLESRTELPTTELPEAVPSTVEGHSGKIILGTYAGKTRLAVLSGRIHGFEGHDPHQVVFVLRALRRWGCAKFIITNSSGSTHRGIRPGTLVFLKDQINFTGRSPLTGVELFGGPRFPDMSDLFSKKWRTQALTLIRKLRIPQVKEGIYIGVPGPAYETPSEISAYRKLGADVVGMSTVWETLALKQMGSEILGISSVCNFGTGLSKTPLSHSEVLDVAKKNARRFELVVGAIINAD